MTEDEKKYEQVGNIRIKEPKKKKNKKKKSSTSSTPIGIKILVWFMVIAMIGSFFLPIFAYLFEIISQG